MAVKGIPIHEIFTSIQGEGIHQGRPTMFIRVVGCNLACHYCDTGYRPQDNRSCIPKTLYTIRELADIISKSNAPYVCFTGGEPLLFKEELYQVIEESQEPRRKSGWAQRYSLDNPRFTFETNGSIPIDNPFTWRRTLGVSYTMDVKLHEYKEGSLHKRNYDYNLAYSLTADRGDEVKIVVETEHDLTLVDEIVTKYPKLNYILSPVHNGDYFVTGELVSQYVVKKGLPNLRVGIQIHKLLGQR